MKKISFVSLYSLIIFCLVLTASSCTKSKKDLVSRKWKVIEAEFAGNKLTEAQVAAIYVFQSDGTFERIEEGQTDEGTWELNEEGTKIKMVFKDDERTVDAKVETLSEEAFTFSWEELTMQRAEKLAPLNK